MGNGWLILSKPRKRPCTSSYSNFEDNRFVAYAQTKAKIMKACAFLPAGAELYKLIQKTFGRLKADPMFRIPTQIEMTRWILDMGGKVEGEDIF